MSPERRAACARNFRLFCETYFPETFDRPWSDDHLRVIAKIELVVLAGGLCAIAMPRHTGKTTLCEMAILWAALYGHRQFGVVIGPDGAHATGVLETIKTRLITNDTLAEDFPEVCYPIRKLEGITQRAVGQLYKGALTRIGWSAERVILPTIEGSAASGCIIQTTGITGGLRGMKFERSDQRSVRPDLVLIDDPQTDESAKSPSQCAERESIINGAVLGLAGPGKKIAALATVTVIREDDLADRLLNRERYPQWQGERTKMLYSLPTNEARWNEYAAIRAAELAAGRGLVAATAFYVRHREEMDAGARAGWLHDFEPDEASAIQHAMNLKLSNERAFWAEYQNEPRGDGQDQDAELLGPDEVASKLSGFARRVVPLDAVRLAAFVDVHKSALYWSVVAWRDDFTGYVIDYGTEPDQPGGTDGYFTLREVKATLALAAPKAGTEGAIYAGLERVTNAICGLEWKRQDGALMKVERQLIDANWGPGTDLVYQFCRQTKYAGIVMPSHGKYVGAAGRPMNEWTAKPGERHGLNWLVPVSQGKRVIRHVLMDVNAWKSFVQTRLSTAMGDPGCLSLFGDDPRAHRMIADHITSEARILTAGRGRTVEEWKPKQMGRDNHWLDCLVGCAVGASMLGCQPPGVKATAAPARQRVSFSEMQRAARARRGAA